MLDIILCFFSESGSSQEGAGKKSSKGKKQNSETGKIGAIKSHYPFCYLGYMYVILSCCSASSSLIAMK